MKKFYLLFLFPLLLGLTGCYDAKDTDDLAYALALGIDKGSTLPFEFTFQIAAPLNIKGGVETAFSIEGGENPLINYSVEGNDIFEALNKTDDIIAKELRLSQLKAIIISEEIINSDILPVKKCLDSERMFRDNIYVAGCKGTSKECLSHTKSPLELNPSKYYELLFSDKSSSRTVSTSLKEFNEEFCFTLPLIKSSESGITPCGTLIINNKKSVFMLSEEQTFAYNLLDGKIKTANFENALISIKGKPKIITDFKKKHCTIEFNIISQEESGTFKKKNIKRSIENSANNLVELFFEEIKCDPLKLKDSQKKYFLTNRDFKKNAITVTDMNKMKVKINYTLTNREA